METLQPQTIFPISRLISDHTDAGVNYVRAVVKNAKTLVVLDTVVLTDNGNRLFTNNWTVPVDSSRQGLYITITTTVYTDSGYTTKNANYGEEINTYLIFDRTSYFSVLANQMSALGGGPDLDYNKVRKIIAEELKKVESKEIDLTPVLEALRLAVVKIEAIQMPDIEIPEQKEPDLAPLMAEMRKVEGMVKAIVIPEQKEVNLDLGPVMEAIKNIDTEIVADRVDESSKDLVRTNENVNSLVEQLKEMIIVLGFFRKNTNAIETPKEKVSTISINRFGNAIKR